METTQNKDITALVKPLPSFPNVIDKNKLKELEKEIDIIDDELTETAKQLHLWADNLTITNLDQLEDAGSQWNFGKNKIKEWKDTLLKTEIKEADSYHKIMTGYRGRNSTMWETFCNKVEAKIKSFQYEQARLAKIEADKIQAELDRQAAEARRIAEEQSRKDAEDKRIAEAQAAEAAGKTQEEVTEILSAEVIPEPVYVPQIQAVVLPKEPPKIEGMNTRKTYKAEVTDIKTLLSAVAAGKVPIEAIKVDQSFLDKMAKAMPETLAYPGVKVVEVETFVKGR